ncbi:uncharacterized protein SPPG_07078 [Spizellomyces punctatus DAOM BR117]|uniref:BRCT domain-containing protein n=1 Tax=Spizellomyces punctatus (strain DAOM BR117) TaxID=645134 RepID=A0A0L0H9N6_SPIPD|nr:uncharacterized protein SPPG_07078 [Spizellomyces punctatus DAOM BR117]KNC97609.1 hypothetical protein SPPG_07078 [Spizellomyces punctatus DAOM BR117]|eukprot:XP_016605649.1 hypothetical protein SPPG_07078 [Spizellomyces punctatus DAOM BR117]
MPEVQVLYHSEGSQQDALQRSTRLWRWAVQPPSITVPCPPVQVDCGAIDDLPTIGTLEAGDVGPESLTITVDIPRSLDGNPSSDIIIPTCANGPPCGAHVGLLLLSGNAKTMLNRSQHGACDSSQVQSDIDLPQLGLSPLVQGPSTCGRAGDAISLKSEQRQLKIEHQAPIASHLPHGRPPSLVQNSQSLALLSIPEFTSQINLVDASNVKPNARAAPVPSLLINQQDLNLLSFPDGCDLPSLLERASTPCGPANGSLPTEDPNDWLVKQIGACTPEAHEPLDEPNEGGNTHVLDGVKTPILNCEPPSQRHYRTMNACGSGRYSRGRKRQRGRDLTPPRIDAPDVTPTRRSSRLAMTPLSSGDARKRRRKEAIHLATMRPLSECLEMTANPWTPERDEPIDAPTLRRVVSQPMLVKQKSVSDRRRRAVSFDLRFPPSPLSGPKFQESFPPELVKPYNRISLHYTQDATQMVNEISAVYDSENISPSPQGPSPEAVFHISSPSHRIVSSWRDRGSATAQSPSPLEGFAANVSTKKKDEIVTPSKQPQPTSDGSVAKSSHDGTPEQRYARMRKRQGLGPLRLVAVPNGIGNAVQQCATTEHEASPTQLLSVPDTEFLHLGEEAEDVRKLAESESNVSVGQTGRGLTCRVGRQRPLSRTESTAGQDDVLRTASQPVQGIPTVGTVHNDSEKALKSVSTNFVTILTEGSPPSARTEKSDNRPAQVGIDSLISTPSQQLRFRFLAFSEDPLRGENGEAHEIESDRRSPRRTPGKRPRYIPLQRDTGQKADTSEEENVGRRKRRKLKMPLHERSWEECATVARTENAIRNRHRTEVNEIEMSSPARAQVPPVVSSPIRPISTASSQGHIGSSSPSFTQMQPNTSDRVCTECGTTVTTAWRNGPKGQASLCCKCGKRWKLKQKLPRASLPPSTREDNMTRGSTTPEVSRPSPGVKSDGSQPKRVKNRPVYYESDSQSSSECDDDRDQDYVEKSGGRRKGQPVASSRQKSRSKDCGKPNGVENAREFETGDRVWALWDDNLFYAAIINSRFGQTTKYMVSFEDGDEALVESQQMRLLKLAPGDKCLAPYSAHTFRVAHVLETIQEFQLFQLRFESHPRTKKGMKQVSLSKIAMSEQLFRENEERTMKKREVAAAQPIQELVKIFGPLATNTRIFRGFGILLTATFGTNAGRDERLYVTQQIEEGGGSVFDDFSQVFEGRKRRNSSPPIILLVASKPLRTKKYLCALGLGVPVVSYAWIRHACLENVLQEYEKYQLCNGFSLELNHWSSVKSPMNGVFHDLHIYVWAANDTFRSDWQDILTAGGATIVSKKLLKRKCHYVVCQNIIPETEKAAFSKWTDAPIVSTEWVVQCLINQRIMNAEHFVNNGNVEDLQ